jgi:hypothetical protein
MKARHVGVTVIGLGSFAMVAMVLAGGQDGPTQNDQPANASPYGQTSFELRSATDPPVGTVVAWLKSLPEAPPCLATGSSVTGRC